MADARELYVIKCQADEGFFSIFIQGAYTQPVPYDCGPRCLYPLPSNICNLNSFSDFRNDWMTKTF